MAEREWVLEADALKTTLMLLACHVNGDRDTATATLVSLVKGGHLFDTAYALAAGFAELGRPKRDRSRPYTITEIGFVPLADADKRELAGLANAVIAASANLRRVDAREVWDSLTLERQMDLTSLLLELFLQYLRAAAPSA